MAPISASTPHPAVLTTLVSIALLFPLPAHAEEATEPEEASSEAQRNEAREQFFRGMELVQQERWEEALSAFDRSLGLFPTQAALYNRGLCLGLMGRPVEAVSVLEQHLAHHGDSISDEQRTASERALENNRARVGHVEIAVEPVEGSEAAPSLFLDGDALGEAPLTGSIAINPGRHQVTATLDGYVDSSEWVEVSAGENASVSLSLEPEPPPTEIVVPTPVEATQSPGRGLRMGGWISTGLGVALLGTAVALVVWNSGRFGDWEQEDNALQSAYAQTELAPQDATELADRAQQNDDLGGSIETMDTVSFALLGVGAAAATAAVVLIVLGYRARGEVEVAVTPGPGGFVLQGRW